MGLEEKLDELMSSGLIEVATFEQILEMDEPDDREFSQSIVYGFFDQAEETFDKLDEALHKEDLAELSSLGHFLKGSSATLGLIKVRDSCEKIQNYGLKKDATGNHDEPNSKVCLDRLTDEIAKAKDEYHDVEKELRKFYGE